MLKRVCIKNFKSHRDTTIDFSPGVTIITGESTHGKSAIIDAIKLVFFNNRTSKGIITDNIKTNQCSVKAEFENCSVEIQKNKGSKTDKYILSKPSGEDLELTHFSRKVPEEISDAIKITNTNFHTQHEEPFLVYGGRTAYSKEINKIIGLGSFIKRVSAINSKILSLSKEMGVTDENIKNIEGFLKSIKEVEYIKDIETDIENLKAKISLSEEKLKLLKEADVNFDVDSLKNIFETISEKINKWKVIENRISENKELINVLKACSEAPIVDIKKIKGILAEMENIKNSLSEKNNLLDLFEKYSKLIKKLKDAKEDLSDFDGEICFNCGGVIKV